MTWAGTILQFAFGTAFGSFLNVLAYRYRPDKFLFSREVAGWANSPASLVGRRSHCPHCGKGLVWYELVPIFSFVAQRGRCRKCRARLSLEYPLVEIAGGLLFVFIPLRIHGIFPLLLAPHLFFLSGLWVLSFLLLLLMATIDLRLRIIPDEIPAGILVLALLLLAFPVPFGVTGGSFLGAYSLLFGVSSTAWVNGLAGFLAGGLGMGVIFLLTRGRGMGMGDVKLAAVLGALFGWPDIAVLLGSAFIFGAGAGIWSIFFGGRTLKSALAFGPFLALAAAFVFFFGFEFVRWYLMVFVG